MPRTAIANLSGDILILDPPVDNEGNVILPEGIDSQVVTLTAEQEAQLVSNAQAALTEATTDKTNTTNLRQQIVTLAQSAVGVALADLTAPQRNALIAGLLHRAGAITHDMKVKPLAQWVR